VRFLQERASSGKGDKFPYTSFGTELAPSSPASVSGQFAREKFLIGKRRKLARNVYQTEIFSTLFLKDATTGANLS
jgi:hypothetical protein